MNRRPLLGLALVALVVLAGCSAFSSGSNDSANSTAASGTAVTSVRTTATQTPSSAATDTAGAATMTPEPTTGGESTSVATAATSKGNDATPRSGNASRRGRTLIGIQAGNLVQMVDGNGETLWTYGNASGYFDVTELRNGNVAAGIILKNQSNCGEFTPPCARTGYRIIDPTPEPHVVTQWTFPVRDGLNSETHDVNPLPDGQFLLTDMEHERILTVARNGTVTWQWNASQRYDAPPDPTVTDWLHINDVDRIGPGRYLVSIRNANQLLIIQRGKGVVEVINEDQNNGDDDSCRNAGPSEQWGQLYDYDGQDNGDVICGDPRVLDHQHNPQYLTPNAILVADSDNNRTVELHKQNGQWRVAWSLSSANGTAFNWPRDADRLTNGNTLITDSKNDRVLEVTESGRVVWSIHTAHWPYEADRLPEGEQPHGQPYNASADG